MTRLAALPLLLLLRTPPCAADRADRPLRVACVGDSLTRGDGRHEARRRRVLAGRGSYPGVLQTLLAGASVVKNFGHGGVTACNASFAPYEATRELAAARAFRPHVVVLMLGTNDAKTKEWERCGGGAAVSAGLGRLIDAFESPRPAVLLVEPPPLLKEKWGIRKALLGAVREAVGELAARRAARGAPSCAAGLAWLLRARQVWGDGPPRLRDYVGDGVHLSARGSARLARAVAAALRAAGCEGAGGRARRGAAAGGGAE